MAVLAATTQGARSQPAKPAELLPGLAAADYTVTQHTGESWEITLTKAFCFGADRPCAPIDSKLRVYAQRDKAAIIGFVEYSQPIDVFGIKLATSSRWERGEFHGLLVDKTCFAELSYCIPAGNYATFSRDAQKQTKLTSAALLTPFTVGTVEFRAPKVVQVQLGDQRTFSMSADFGQPTTVGQRTVQGQATVRFDDKLAAEIVRGQSAAPFEFHGWQLPAGYDFSEGFVNRWQFSQRPASKGALAHRAANNPMTSFGDEVAVMREEANPYNKECQATVFGGMSKQLHKYGKFAFSDFTITTISNCSNAAAMKPVTIVDGVLKKSMRLGAIRMPEGTVVTLYDNILVHAAGYGIMIGRHATDELVNQDQANAAVTNANLDSEARREAHRSKEWHWVSSFGPAHIAKRYRLTLVMPVCQAGIYIPPRIEYAVVTPQGQATDEVSKIALANAAQRCPKMSQPVP